MQYSLRQKSRGVSCIRCYTTKFVNYKDLKPFVKDLKEVYQAATEKLALTSCITSYVVSVRQTRDLPVVSLFPHPASFRFHLTMDTLAFGYILPTTGWIRDFNPLETCAARRTRKKPKLKSFGSYHSAQIKLFQRVRISGSLYIRTFSVFRRFPF